MPENSELKQQAAECIAAAFGVEARDVIVANEFANIEGWDSLRHLQIFSELESELGYSFSVDQMVSITSLDQVISVIEKKSC